MTEAKEEEKLKLRFNQIMHMLYKWPEDKVKTILKEQLEREGWAITQIAMGTEKGKDLETTKDDRVIHIEVKGEPKSPLSYQVERRAFIGQALTSLITHMNEGTANNAFCMAFPDNDYYLRGVRRLVPLYVRNRLRVFTIFVGDGNVIQILLPNSNEVRTLNRFEELFNTD